MSDPYSPDAWRDHNGQHSHQSLWNYGTHAAQHGLTPPPILPTETAREAQIRQEAFDAARLNNGS